MNANLSMIPPVDGQMDTRQPVRIRLDRGFSILELMVALFVLLFGFIAMVNLIATGIVVNRSSNRLTSLTQLAADKLEELRTLDNADPRVQAGGSLDNNQTGDVGGITVSYFDTVFVNQRDGSVTRTDGPDDSGDYSSITRTMAGVTTPPSTGGEPTEVSYRRRWLIESNQPIAGATRITVEVAVKTNKLSEPDPLPGQGFRQVIRMRAVR